MDQVGYDTYCKLLDEVIKEQKGMQVEEDMDITIDINVSSYIPNEFINNNAQKIEIYQNIAFTQTEEDIQRVIEDITDRYGKMPKEMSSLIEVARIKEICKSKGITKVMQKQNNIVFNFSKDNEEININGLINKYKDRIKFSPGKEPYITYKLKDKNNNIEEIEEFLRVV